MKPFAARLIDRSTEWLCGGEKELSSVREGLGGTAIDNGRSWTSSSSSEESDIGDAGGLGELAVEDGIANHPRSRYQRLLRFFQRGSRTS